MGIDEDDAIMRLATAVALGDLEALVKAAHSYGVQGGRTLQEGDLLHPTTAQQQDPRLVRVAIAAAAAGAAGVQQDTISQLLAAVQQSQQSPQQVAEGGALALLLSPTLPTIDALRMRLHLALACGEFERSVLLGYALGSLLICPGVPEAARALRESALQGAPAALRSKLEADAVTMAVRYGATRRSLSECVEAIQCELKAVQAPGQGQREVGAAAAATTAAPLLPALARCGCRWRSWQPLARTRQPWPWPTTTQPHVRSVASSWTSQPCCRSWQKVGSLAQLVVT